MPSDRRKLGQLRSARLVDEVRQLIEESILSGKVRPAERLTETWITEELGVSRTTVREALLMLQRQGLVTSSPRRGTFVTRLSRADALDLGYNRALLEGHAVRVGFHRLNEELFARLEALLGSMRDCSLPEDTPRLIQLDLAFHQLLVEAARSPRLLELWSNLNGQIRALYLTTLENERADIVYVVEFHEQLLAALHSGDPRVAQRAVFEHYVRRDRDNDPQQLDLLDETADAMAEFMLGPAPARAAAPDTADDQTGALL